MNQLEYPIKVLVNLSGLLEVMALFPFLFSGVPLLFIGFVTYEKWEDEIDELSSKASPHILKLKSDVIHKFSKLHSRLRNYNA